MAKVYGGVTVEAYVPTKDGRLLDVDKDLTDEQRKYLATELSIRLLNSFYHGKATFFRKGSAPGVIAAEEAAMAAAKA